MNSYTNKNKALLLGIGISLAYAASYIAKTVLSGVLPSIIEDGIFTKTDLGAMGSAFMLIYGIGQLINGVIGDILNPKKMIFTGLIGAGVLVLVFPLFTSAKISIVLWGFVGFLCSMLWGPLTKIVAENTENKVARLLMICLTAASIIGSMLAYIICAIVAFWKNAFIISGLSIILTSFVWLITLTYMEKKKLISYKTKAAKKLEGQKGEGITALHLIENAIIPVIVCIMLNGVIRNAASFWIPTYINEVFGASPSFSSAIIIISPIINLIGVFVSYKILKLFNDNEHILCAVLFAFAAFMFAFMLLFKNYMIISIAAMFLAGAAMSGVCTILFSVYVLRFSSSGKTSGIAGTMDFTAYMTASLANVLIGRWTDKLGWNFVISSWLIVTLAGVCASYISHRVIKRTILNIHQQ